MPEDISYISAPVHGKEEECIDVKYRDDIVTVGIKNRDIAAYLTYSRKTLPDFLIWKMLGESDYVVGLEPRTTSYGGENIGRNNKFISLKPFEEYKTSLNFRFEKME